jgi:hypothetical protein
MCSDRLLGEVDEVNVLRVKRRKGTRGRSMARSAGYWLRRLLKRAGVLTLPTPGDYFTRPP